MGANPDADRVRFEMLAKSLTNHTPEQDAILLIEGVRETAKGLGLLIISSCPDGRERSLALTHLEETVMWAVKSLVLPP